LESRTRDGLGSLSWLHVPSGEIVLEKDGRNIGEVAQTTDAMKPGRIHTMETKVRSTIYVDGDVLRQFDIICSREGLSRSEKVEAFMATYNLEHAHGNPQTLLQRHFDPPTHTCSLCNIQTKGLINRVLFKNGLDALCCDSCLEEKKTKGLVRRVISKV
jgi:hypothetical protein